MLSDLYVYEVQQDQSILHAIRLHPIYPKPRWIPPRMVLAAVHEGGWWRLVDLTGTNVQHGDRPSYAYPREVTRVWVAYNPGCLSIRNTSDVAAELVREGVINEVVLNPDGRVVKTIRPEDRDAEGGEHGQDAAAES